MVKPSKITKMPSSSRLSEELSKEYKTHSIAVRKGDVVHIMRGDFRGTEGGVIKVDYERNTIHIEGVTREKADGNTVFVPIHQSKVMIRKLNLKDKLRKDILNRRASDSIENVKKG